MASLFFSRGEGGGGGDEPAERELQNLVRAKVRQARLVEANDAADRILHPGDGGDSVSAETMQAASAVLQGVAATAQASARDARAEAQAAQASVEAARREASQQATAAAAAPLATMERTVSSAFDQVGKLVERLEASAARESAAHQARISDANAQMAPLMSLVVTLAEKGINPPPAPQPQQAQDPVALLMKVMELQKLITPQAESAKEYELREMTKARVQAWADQNETNKQVALKMADWLNNSVGPGLFNALGNYVQSKIGSAAASSLGPMGGPA